MIDGVSYFLLIKIKMKSERKRKKWLNVIGTSFTMFSFLFVIECYIVDSESNDTYRSEKKERIKEFVIYL
jgi:hypothetical protein